MSRKPDDLIETYLHDVARNLMPKHRTDVVFELRALLHEGLQDKAREAGRLPDEQMTIDYLREFGRPADVAARYHQPITLIEPADTPMFLFLSIIGVSLATVLPYVDRVQGEDVVIRDWPEALWIVGLLVIVFAVNGYARRRWPQKNMWRPRAIRPDFNTPAWTLVATFFGVVSLAIYTFPGAFAQLTRMSALSPGLTPEAFAYTDSFRSWLRMPWVYLLGGVVILVNLWSVIRGRWTKPARWIEILFSISLGVQLGWHASYGDIVEGEAADALVRLVFMVADIVILIQAAIRAWREWGRIDAPAGLPGGAAQPS
jgi:uncharacterized membrane protein